MCIRKTVLKGKGVIIVAIEFEYSYLRGFIREHFGTNANFAKFLGVSNTALYDRLKNKTPFTQQEIDRVVRCATATELSPDDINRLFFTHKIRKTV